MAKQKAKLAAGVTVRIRDGVLMPEFETLNIGGWSGRVLELQGRGATQKVILEWDTATLQLLPEEYQIHCELQGLFYGMACIPVDCLETLGE